MDTQVHTKPTFFKWHEPAVNASQLCKEHPTITELVDGLEYLKRKEFRAIAKKYSPRISFDPKKHSLEDLIHNLQSLRERVPNCSEKLAIVDRALIPLLVALCEF